MPEFPTITHVALTVTSLDRSVPWYETLFDKKAVLDEDTGPFRHVVWLVGGTLVGLHEFPDLQSTEPFNERRVGLDHLAFACANRANWPSGSHGSTRWASPTVASSTPPTGPACRSETLTTSRWSSSHRQADLRADPRRQRSVAESGPNAETKVSRSSSVATVVAVGMF